MNLSTTCKTRSPWSCAWQFLPEGVDAGSPAGTIAHEPGSVRTFGGRAGGAPLIVTQTPQLLPQSLCSSRRSRWYQFLASLRPHFQCQPQLDMRRFLCGRGCCRWRTVDCDANARQSNIHCTRSSWTLIPGVVDVGVVPSATVDHEPGSYHFVGAVHTTSEKDLNEVIDLYGPL